jgi:hypothetical protein
MNKGWVTITLLTLIGLTWHHTVAFTDDARQSLPAVASQDTSSPPLSSIEQVKLQQNVPTPQAQPQPSVAPTPQVIPEETVETGMIVISVLFALCCCTCFCWYRWNRKRRYAMWADEYVEEYVQL